MKSLAIGRTSQVSAEGSRSRPTMNPWVTYILRRVMALLISLFVLVLLTFALVRLIPGDPTASIAGLDADSAAREAIRARLGLDLPLADQFAQYVRNLATGDLGASFITNEPVADIIAQRLQVSGTVAVWALVVVMLLSIPAGMMAAAYTKDDRHRGGELAFTGITSAGGAVPEFLMATLLAAVFGAALGLLPIAGIQGGIGYILPVAAVAIRPTFLLARIMRVETLNALTQDFVRTARSKRLPSRHIYFAHVLPNVLTAALAVGGLLFAGLIGGAVLVENVFALPGLGTTLVDAVINSDYPVVQGVVLVLGTAVVVVNAFVDFALAAIDPRTMVKDS